MLKNFNRFKALLVASLLTLALPSFGKANCRNDLGEVAIARQLQEQNLKLGERVDALVSQWPTNAAVVEGFRFGSPDKLGAPRQVLVLSLNGLDEVGKKALIEQYLDAFQKNNVSFPFSSKISHLFIRIGRKSKDMIVATYLTNFRNYLASHDVTPSKNIRIEPVFSLAEDSEDANMQAYVSNIEAHPIKTLWFGFIPGVASGLTKGKLDNNKPARWCELHNCTSTFTTAPVGAQGEPLWQLAGAEKFEDFHKPPIWLQYLVEKADANRVPYVIYWTNAALGEAVTKELPTTAAGQYTAKVLY